MCAHRRSALQRFRRELPTASLRDILTRPVREEIRAFLEPSDTSTRLEHRLVMALLPHRATTPGALKRCTPCEMCFEIHTYNRYCSACDQRLWWDVT